MKYIYSVCILLFLYSCQTNKTNSIPKEIKDKNFYSALSQAIDISEKNNNAVKSIYTVYTKNNIYLYTSNLHDECLPKNSFRAVISIRNKNYSIIFSENIFLSQYIDVENLEYRLENYEFSMNCDYSGGYVFRFEKQDVGNYRLIKLSNFDTIDSILSLEEDLEYLPNIKVRIPEPEPQNNSYISSTN